MALFPFSQRFFLFLVGVLTILISIVLFSTALDELLEGEAPAAVAVQPPVLPALSRHVMVFCIDGLRWDLAQNPSVAPNYAKAMREHTHGAVMASPVTMTSSAVRGIGVGLRSDLEQIVMNLNASAVKYNHLLDNAKAAGIRTALAGDITWAQILGDFDEQVVDANGIALETDNSDEILDAARRMVQSETPPHLLIIHLIAPDHFGHAYGTLDMRYRELIRKIDGRMQAFFDEISPRWTVLAVSDHGQTDTGTHGMATDITRRTPLFAFGPGIRPGVELGEVDQVDLSATLAVLLGISGPARGRGTALVEMLDINEEQAASVVCADARRVIHVAREDGQESVAERLATLANGCGTNAPAVKRAAAARATVRAYDRAIDEARSGQGRTASLVAGLSVLFLLLAGAWSCETNGNTRFYWRKRLGLTLTATMISAITVALTLYVERMAQPYDDVVRGVLFAVAGVALLLIVGFPSFAADWFHRMSVVGWALVVGAVAWSYPTNTPHLAYGVLLLFGLLWLLAPRADLAEGRVRTIVSGRFRLPWWRVVLFGLALVALLPAGYYHGDPTPPWLRAHPAWMLGLGIVALVGWLLAGATMRDCHASKARILIDGVVAMAVASSSLLLRRVIPADVGLAAMFVLPAGAVIALLARRNTLALGLLFAGYGWVSRDAEVLPLASAAIGLEAVLHTVVRAKEPGDVAIEHRPWAVVLLATTLFAAVFLVRIGLQGGLDLTNIDYGVGGFGDPEVSQFRVGRP